MGLIQNLMSGIGKNKKEFKEKFKQAQEEDKINGLIEERKKSSNRRELERHFKEQEEQQITKELEKVRKKKGQEIWKSKTTILGVKGTMLKTDRPILKEKNIFQRSKNSVLKGEHMFFKS